MTTDAEFDGILDDLGLDMARIMSRLGEDARAWSVLIERAGLRDIAANDADFPLMLRALNLCRALHPQVHEICVARLIGALEVAATRPICMHWADARMDPMQLGPWGGHCPWCRAADLCAQGETALCLECGGLHQAVHPSGCVAGTHRLAGNLLTYARFRVRGR